MLLEAARCLEHDQITLHRQHAVRVSVKIDVSEDLFGKSDKSNRDGFPVYVANRLEAVKWRNWKVVFYDEQRDWWSPPTRLGNPKAFDLITEPKEEYPATGLRSTWSAGPVMKIVAEFEESLQKYPPIPPGTPDRYTPPPTAASRAIQ